MCTSDRTIRLSLPLRKSVKEVPSHGTEDNVSNFPQTPTLVGEQTEKNRSLRSWRDEVVKVSVYCQSKRMFGEFFFATFLAFYEPTRELFLKYFV